MTVVAWDGQTLAADKLACHGWTRNTVTKIFRHGKELLGVTGTLSVGLEMRDWYAAGAERSAFPASNRDHDKGSSLVVVKPNGEVWKYESGPVPHRIEGKFCAFGSGDEAALVALACGKTAAEAVGLVSMFNTTCGNGIDALTLTE
jgi:hypothetical protein